MIAGMLVATCYINAVHPNNSTTTVVDILINGIGHHELNSYLNSIRLDLFTHIKARVSQVVSSALE